MHSLLIVALLVGIVQASPQSGSGGGSGSGGSGGGGSGSWKWLDTLNDLYEDWTYPNYLNFIGNHTRALKYFNPDLIVRSGRSWGPISGDIRATVGLTFLTQPHNLSIAPYFFSSHNIRQYTESGNHLAISTVDMFSTVTSLGESVGLVATNFTWVDWFWFDDNDKIKYWDQTVFNVDAWVVATGGTLSTPASQTASKNKLCDIATTLCNSTQTGFTSSNPLQECKDYLDSIPYSNFDLGAHKNTGNCRQSRINTVRNDPGIFCPLLGKLPNIFCTDDFDYTDLYQNPFPPGIFFDDD